MEIDRKELKGRARAAMGLTRPRFWVVALVYFLMTTGLSYLPNQLLPFLTNEEAAFTVSLFCRILMSLYVVIVQFSFDLWSLWTSRRLDPGLGSLLQGFSVAGRVILMELSILGRIMGWSVLLSIVAVFPLVYASLLLNSALLYPLVLLLVIGLSAAVWTITLRYSLAPYLLADSPDDGVAAAVRRSVELTRGWKWELFKLELSFVGWSLLSLLLAALVLVTALWRAGFFQALTAFPVAELPELLANYSLWQSGAPADLLGLTQAQNDLFTLYRSVYGGVGTAVLTDLVTLPVFLWLTPYRSVSRAGFFDARLRLQREGTPPL